MCNITHRLISFLCFKLFFFFKGGKKSRGELRREGRMVGVEPPRKFLAYQKHFCSSTMPLASYADTSYSYKAKFILSSSEVILYFTLVSPPACSCRRNII